MTFVVGLAGPGQVGKSTTAKNIVMTFNIIHPHLKVNRYAFAQPIYEIAESLTGIPIDTLKNEVYKEMSWSVDSAPIHSLAGWSPRKFLQIIGTECFRNNIDPNFWVETTLKKISHLDIAIIEDARFSNEFEKCDIVVELQREGIDYAMNHLSAMPPEEKYINYRLQLSHGMSYEPITKFIIDKYLTKKDFNNAV